MVPMRHGWIDGPFCRQLFLGGFLVERGCVSGRWGDVYIWRMETGEFGFLEYHQLIRFSIVTTNRLL